MAEFLTTTGTSHHLENIIIEAKQNIILVSPFLKLSKTLLERLKDAANRKVKIRIIYGKEELNKTEKSSLDTIPNLELYFFENLHAKCYANESEMIITSMNMYEFSERKNREMGILINAVSDQNIYTKATNEVNSILQYSKQIKVTKPNFVPETKSSYNSYSGGFCIRCAKKISYNPSAPYCRDCYKSWSHWNNYDFEEKVCHGCGNTECATMAKPECYTCYKN